MSGALALALVCFALLGAFIGSLRCVIFWRRRRDMPNALEFLAAATWGGICGVLFLASCLIILRAAGLSLGS
jgi:cyanate permease